jgi:hypothetical protein
MDANTTRVPGKTVSKCAAAFASATFRGVSEGDGAARYESKKCRSSFHSPIPDKKIDPLATLRVTQ